RVRVEGGRATGVELLLDGHPETALAGSEVILAAGTINSPHLLLLSGIGPVGELARHGIDPVADAPEVGQNLLDHVACGLLCRTRDVRTLARADTPLNLLRWLLAGGGPLASNVAEGAAFVRSDPCLAAPDLELLFAPVLFENEGLTRPTEHGLTLATILLQPRSRGTVRLASSDPVAAPFIDPGYFTDEGGDDLRLMLHGLRLARRIASTRPLSDYIAGESEPGAEARDDDALRAHIRRRSQTLYHPVGTCRAGTDARSVVDPQLRVRGVDCLRVVDASVFPRLPRGHPNWPVVAVAERAAELISRPASSSPPPDSRE
ncbi:MAG: GMC family oxidoreductase, partial [Gaiella sp.]